MKRNGFCFYFTILDVDLVTTQNDRYVLTYSHQIFVPSRHIFICDTRCYIKHDYGTLALNVVAVTQATKFLLTGCVPYVESDWSAICGKSQRMNFDAECGCKKKCKI